MQGVKKRLIANFQELQGQSHKLGISAAERVVEYMYKDLKFIAYRVFHATQLGFPVPPVGDPPI